MEETAAFDVDLTDVAANVKRLGARRLAARSAFEDATEELRNACVRAVVYGMSESEAARLAGVRRQTIREWSGKSS